MNTWLKEPIVNMPCDTYQGRHNCKEMYYTEKEMIKYARNMPKPGTRYHDADCLFKYLVDYCIENTIVNTDNTPIINSSMKRQFLKFVYETSVK
jgi:hypothetical protein